MSEQSKMSFYMKYLESFWSPGCIESIFLLEK